MLLYYQLRIKERRLIIRRRTLLTQDLEGQFKSNLKLKSVLFLFIFTFYFFESPSQRAALERIKIIKKTEKDKLNSLKATEDAKAAAIAVIIPQFNNNNQN